MTVSTIVKEDAASQVAPQITTYAGLYKQELLDNILPFWLKNGKDRQNGGYFTCLDRKGQVFDTDKFMWLQGRGVWCFSYMYQHLLQEQEWLDMAVHGADFMEKYGRDGEGNWYFSLTAEGKPLVQPYNIFSDCFATIGFAALDKVLPRDRYKQIAVATFENILRRQHNWKAPYNKAYPGTRPLKNFSLPMILSNLALSLEHILGADRVNSMIPALIHDIMEVFYKPEYGLILENVMEDGSFSNSFEGRIVNPGHTIEAMWFMMDLAVRIQDVSLVKKATEIMLHTLEYGWDKKYGGLFYFLDVKGVPPLQLEWDQKLWWVHVEALVALAKSYALTRDERSARWFETIHQYTWQHFRDESYGEWFGYLNRRGEVLLDLKGGKWKGCFHIPRALYEVYSTFENMQKTDLYK